MGIVAIDSFDDPRVAAYRDVKDRDLRFDYESFLVEGAGPLRTLLTQSRFEPESLLLSPRALRTLAPELGQHNQEIRDELKRRTNDL